MASNLAKASTKTATKTSVTTRTSTETETKKEVPAGAEIVSKNVTTSTEQIENGYLISKNYDITYRAKGSEHTDYLYYSKKWFSKTDPLKIELTDKTLSDAFEED